jgi:hypothetical protein
MNVNAIAYGELRHIGLLLFFFNSIDHAVHRVPTAGGQIFSNGRA